MLQRQVAAPVETDDSLVGLKRGDGLDFGTEDRRQRVSLLQERLNEHMQAGIDVDGMFGPKTSEVLREFQEGVRLLQQEPVDEATAEALSAPVGNIPVPGGPPSSDQAAKAAQITFAGQQLDAAADSVQLGAQKVMEAGGILSLGASAAAAGGDLNLAGQQIAAMAASLKAAAANFEAEGERQQSSTTVLGSANPLVGLRRGDGLVFGTFERRPRVSLLQEKLNDRGAAGIQADGMWGQLTSDALGTFQAQNGLPIQDQVDADTADALMGTGAVAGSSGPLPASLGEAGQRLQSAAAEIAQAANQLTLAGIDLQVRGPAVPDPTGTLPPGVPRPSELTDSLAGKALQSAANDFFFASGPLSAAGQGLISAAGDPSGVASPTLRSAGSSLGRAGSQGSGAGGSMLLAGAGLATSSEVQERTAAEEVSKAGRHLEAAAIDFTITGALLRA